MRVFSRLLAFHGFAILALEVASAVASPCNVRVWVRAPDLEPGQVVQGHVKVKLDGSCDDIASYSLGLRFAERSWVKTRREGAKLPKRPVEGPFYGPLLPLNDSIYEPGILGLRPWPDAGTNDSLWETYERDVKDPALWLVREEERIGFETKYTLCDGGSPSHDLVKHFAILVPSTNYPPAFDVSLILSLGGDTDAADTEHIYAYFLDVSFLNGTHLQVPAGYTTFNAASTVPAPARETVNVTATRSSRCNEGHGCKPEDATSQDQFTLEITFPQGRSFVQGSVNDITIVSHQLGPGLQRASGFEGTYAHVKQQRGWAAKLAADKEAAEKLRSTGPMHMHPPLRQRWPRLDNKAGLRQHIIDAHMVSEHPRFAQDGTVGNGTAFSTEPVTARFNIAHDLYPPFDMYYQTSEPALELLLEVRNVSSSDASTPLDEAYGWTPGRDDKVAEVLHASIPILVHRPPEERARLEASATSHYLSPAARAPVFVDPSAIVELLGKAVAERDDLAPIAQAAFNGPADGNIVKNRYYGRDIWRNLGSTPYYFGDTWLRKVVEGGESIDATARGDVAGSLVIQA